MGQLCGITEKAESSVRIHTDEDIGTELIIRPPEIKDSEKVIYHYTYTTNHYYLNGAKEDNEDEKSEYFKITTSRYIT